VIFYYLDANAWVKRYCKERGTAWVQGLLERNPAMACASLGLIEVMGTLARKKKAGEMDTLAFERNSRDLLDDWQGFMEIQLIPEAVDIARDLARDRALRGADAVRLASALLMQRRFADEDDRLVLVTSDHELKTAAESSGLTVIDPEAQERQSSSQAEEKSQKEQREH